MVYKLISDTTALPALDNFYHKNTMFINIERSNFDYFWATIAGTNQRMYGFFEEVDIDIKSALKLNLLLGYIK